MKIVRAIGRVIKNPVKKIFRRRRLTFFITPYPLKSLGRANPTNRLPDGIAEIISYHYIMMFAEGK